ncbi:hypothetical protein FACS1894187_21970 [Synergistales bacterium]|nr:hypothetical protein FACS1894187_21970 [Synergistales bacterium]
MTTATLDRREKLVRRVRELPDSTVDSVMEFIDEVEEHEPNAETIAVLEDIEARRDMVGPFNTLEEMFRDFGVKC